MGALLNRVRSRPFTAALVFLGAAVLGSSSVDLGYLEGTIYYIGLILAVRGATSPGWVRRGTVIYAIAATIAHIGDAAAGGLSAPVLFSLDFAFSAVVPVLVIRHVLSQEKIARDELAGALVSYLLIGVCFGFAHSLVESFFPGSYGSPGAGHPADDLGRFTYFSFVTLTTLGYGDIVPTSPFAQGLSILEAALGQGYLAILIAHLVGRINSQPAKNAR